MSGDTAGPASRSGISAWILRAWRFFNFCLRRRIELNWIRLGGFDSI